MFEGGQAVVLVPVGPGVTPSTHTPTIQLQTTTSLPTVSAATSQTVYLPYNLVLKQELPPQLPRRPSFQRILLPAPPPPPLPPPPQVTLQHNQFILPMPTSSSAGGGGINSTSSRVIVSEDPIVVATTHHGAVPTASVSDSILTTQTMTVTEVKPETLINQIMPVGSIETVLQGPLAQKVQSPPPAAELATINPIDLFYQKRPIQKEENEVKEESKTCNEKTMKECLVNKDHPVSKKSPEPNITVSPAEEPDTTALTTLAIVCDNIGSSRDSQYIVKVELEEPVVTPPRKKSMIRSSRHKNDDGKHHRSHHKKQRSSSSPQVNSKLSQRNDVNHGHKERSSRKRSSSEMDDCSRLTSTVDHQTPLKKSRSEKAKNSSEKKIKQEPADHDTTSSNKKSKKNKSCVNVSVEKSSKCQIEDAHTNIQTSIKRLQSESQTKPQGPAELSPASTIPYGDDSNSNDSADFSGRAPVPSFRCTLCSRSYITERRLKLHIGLLHQEPSDNKSPLAAIFSCANCTKAYTSQKRLDLHQLLVHQNPDRRNSKRSRRKRLEELEKESLRKMRGSRDAEGGSESDESALHACGLCKRQYTSKSRLTLHIGLCHDKRIQRKSSSSSATSDKNPAANSSHARVSSSAKKINITIKREQRSNSNQKQQEVLGDVQIKAEPVDDAETDDVEADDVETDDAIDVVAAAVKRERHNCAKCGLIFANLNLYTEHQAMHEGEKSLESHLRKKKNRIATIFRYYCSTRSTNKQRPYACKLCKKTFVEKRCATNHVNNVHEIYDGGQSIYSCGLCAKDFIKRQLLERHMSSHNDTESESLFSCAKCSKKCTQKAHLERHMRLMHMDPGLVRTFTCDICGNSFKLKSHLNRHMRMHDGSLPFKCDVCQFKCADRHALRQHFRKHSGERPFKCSFCKWAFTLKNNLESHVVNIHPETLSESERQRHQCRVCKKVMSKGLLKSHMMAVHSNARPFKCEKCGNLYKKKQDLQKHAVTHEPPKLKCAKCKKCYWTKSQLKAHLEKRH